LAEKIIPEMTYSVSSGTVNPTVRPQNEDNHHTCTCRAARA